MKTDAEIESFLRSNEPKVLLAEIDLWDGTAVQTFRCSDSGYNSNLSPGFEHEVYPDYINRAPSFRQSLATEKPAVGEIIIDNTDGVRDNWITDYAFDGRKIRLLHGSPDWEYDDFRQVFIGVTETRSVNNDKEIRLKPRDPELYLDQPIQSTLIATGSNAGDPEPIAYGEIFNAPAILLDGTTHKYQLSDIAMQSFTKVKDDQINVAGYSPFIATGEITLNVAAVGKTTVDFKGAYVGGVLLEKAGEIIDHIITTRTDLPAEFYDAQAFIDLDVAIPYKHNIYETKKITARQVIDKILKSINAKLTRTRDGKISVVVRAVPEAIASMSFNADSLAKSTFKPIKIIAPWKAASMGYKQNHLLQPGLRSAITEDLKATVERKYSIVTGTNNIAVKHPRAIEPDLIESTLTNQADATAALTAILAIHAVERLVFELSAYSIFYLLAVGQTVELIHKRFGFSVGKKAVVYKIDDNYTGGNSRVQLWL